MLAANMLSGEHSFDESFSIDSGDMSRLLKIENYEKHRQSMISSKRVPNSTKLNKNFILPHLNHQPVSNQDKFFQHKLNSPTYKLLVEVNKRFKSMGYRVNSDNNLQDESFNFTSSNDFQLPKIEANNSEDSFNKMSKLPLIAKPMRDSVSHEGHRWTRTTSEQDESNNNTHRSKLEIWLPSTLVEEDTFYPKFFIRSKAQLTFRSSLERQNNLKPIKPIQAFNMENKKSQELKVDKIVQSMDNIQKLEKERRPEREIIRIDRSKPTNSSKLDNYQKKNKQNVKDTKKISRKQKRKQPKIINNVDINNETSANMSNSNNNLSTNGAFLPVIQTKFKYSKTTKPSSTEPTKFHSASLNFEPSTHKTENESNKKTNYRLQRLNNNSVMRSNEKHVKYKKLAPMPTSK